MMRERQGLNDISRIAPIDWQTRQHLISFTLNPYYGTANLSFADAKNTLLLNYISTTLYSWQGAPTSGANPTFIETLHGSSIQYPVVAANETRLVTDPEGLVQNKDGTFWMSDEYGPYVHLLSSSGKVLTTITPPPAAIPRINGTVNFNSLVNPDTGRSSNQGLEGLTASASGDKLYALMQSALMQEGGGNKTINRYARFFKWDVSNLNHIQLEEEYVVPLPQSSKPETYAQSEIHWLNKNQFLVLARDGNGNGGSSAKATYKYV
jgi:Esterase-like activity of phytase